MSHPPPRSHSRRWVVLSQHLPKNNDPIFAVPEPKKKEETAKQKPANKVEVIADQVSRGLGEWWGRVGWCLCFQVRRVLE